MATRREVAQRAGVSVATVSNVLNRSRRVTPEVTQRVLEAAEALQYRPNLLARSLATGVSRHVVMLVDSLTDPRSAELLAGAQAEASENGYLLSAIAARAGDPRILRELDSRGVDGVLIAPSCDRPRITEQLPAGLPSARLSYSDVDCTAAMEELLRYLHELGHERIAFLGGVSGPSAGHLRYAAWRLAMERTGLEIDPALISDISVDSPADEAEGSRAMEDLLLRRVPFTAVCAGSDRMAWGAVRVLSLRGLSVPGDISVAGCGCLRCFAGAGPRLTTLDMRTFDLGRRLFLRLLYRLRGQDPALPALSARFIPGTTASAAGDLLPHGN